MYVDSRRSGELRLLPASTIRGSSRRKASFRTEGVQPASGSPKASAKLSQEQLKASSEPPTNFTSIGTDSVVTTQFVHSNDQVDLCFTFDKNDSAVVEEVEKVVAPIIAGAPGLTFTASLTPAHEFPHGVGPVVTGAGEGSHTLPPGSGRAAAMALGMLPSKNLAVRSNTSSRRASLTKRLRARVLCDRIAPRRIYLLQHSEGRYRPRRSRVTEEV